MLYSITLRMITNLLMALIVIQNVYGLHFYLNKEKVGEMRCFNEQGTEISAKFVIKDYNEILYNLIILIMRHLSVTIFVHFINKFLFKLKFFSQNLIVYLTHII